MSTKRIFSTDTDSSTVTVLEQTDQGFQTVRVIPIGNGPRGAVKFTDKGLGYVSNNDGDTISEIDAKSLEETAKIKVGISPTGVGIVPGDRYLLSSNSGSNSISVVDLNSRQELFQIAVGKQPRHMDITPNGDYAYIAVSGGDYISKTDIRSLRDNRFDSIRQEVREVKRVFVGDGANPYSAAVSPDGRFVFSANNQVNYISVIETDSDSIVATVEIGTKGSRGTAFSPDGTKAYVSIEDTSEIIEIDTSNFSIVRRIPSGPGPRGLVVDAGTGSLYVAAFARNQRTGDVEFAESTLNLPNSMSVISLLPNAFTEECIGASGVPVGQGPCSISIYEFE